MVTSDWKTYMQDYDEGLGTVYERFMLEELFERFMQEYDIKTILEAPIFGMVGVTGINSVYFAKRGCGVTLVDDNKDRVEMVRGLWKELGLQVEVVNVNTPAKLPFDDNSFDFIWNFAALWHVEDAPSLIDELARVSSRLVFICVPNRIQVGYILRRLIARKFFKTVNEKWIDLGLIEKTLEKNSFKIVGRGIFDVPPWPDTCFPVAKILPAKENKGWRWSMMDYYKGNNELKDRVMRYSFIEKSMLPKSLKKLWAHHNYLLGEKVG